MSYCEQAEGQSLVASDDPLILHLREDGFIDKQLVKWREFSDREGVGPGRGRSVKKENVDDFLAGSLYESVDGSGLRSITKARTSEWPIKHVGSKWV